MKLQEKTKELELLKENLIEFVENECIPAEIEFDKHLEGRIGPNRWSLDAIPPILSKLQKRAKELGFWNLFLPHHAAELSTEILPIHLRPKKFLSNTEYAPLCEIMGRSFLAPDACNCNAPDTGNMEVLLQFGSYEQQLKYLKPLLDGTIRSAFLMTEPDVASSDATNIQTSLEKSGNNAYELNGRKWWSTGAMDPRCKVVIVLAQTPSSTSIHSSHTMIVLPFKTQGIQIVRPLTVFGHDDAPHGHAELLLEHVAVSQQDLILGHGKGFQIAQARLGPGRVHHCMRVIGLASRCYKLMLERTLTRQTFNQPLWKHGMIQEKIAQSKIKLEMARLLTLQCASSMDLQGNKKSRDTIAMIKIIIPKLCFEVIDSALQVFGGMGVSQDTVIAKAFTWLRCLRIADGPDEVHIRTLAKIEIKKYMNTQQSRL